MKKKAFIFVGISVIFCLSCPFIINREPNVPLFAHSAQLDVEYDDCYPELYIDENNIGDGEDEKWYEFVKGGKIEHIPHSEGTTIIRYYVSDVSNGGSSSWNDISDGSRREYIKASLIDSIKKWNNISFYKPSYNGLITKHRLVDIREGTYSNHNLTIYPSNVEGGYYGSCEASENSDYQYIDSIEGIHHFHYDQWDINFNIAYHLFETEISEHILNRTGAHELGHVLGLKDIDSCEAINQNTSYHHEELLMGYSNPITAVEHRQTEITYKDLVGVAITRGLHTDADHSWIYDYASSSEGNRKLICSICNGVKYVNSLADYTYVTYKACNNLHNLSSSNMFPVASYGNKDYYKCKYCRYVAPFTSLVDQDYVATDHYNSTYHIVTNQVNGLSYSCLEEHTFDSNGVCTGCSQISPHSFNNNYVYYTSNTHKAYCTCGTYILKSHAIDGTRTYTFHGHLYGPCIDCGAIIDLGAQGPIIPVPNIINQMVTDNGSYILPNGIYIIVQEDLEAYLNGTLIFHPYSQINN